MFLSKVQLRNDTKLASIAPILSPHDSHERVGISHRLIWTLFDSSERETADFLWKEISQNTFYVLSERRPAPNGFLDVTTKDFSPVFTKGQRLLFVLRVNATVSRMTPDQTRGHRESLLTKIIREMNAKGIRDPAERETQIKQAVLNWLDRQGADIFSLDSNNFSIQGENNVRISYKARAITFDFLDIEGNLTVSNPEGFKAKLLSGFGRAKAFGCGLMLVKPIG